MRRLLLAALLVATAAPCFAAAPPKAKKAVKRRTIAQVVELAMREGRPSEVSIAIGQHLGYESDMPAQALHYENKYAENGYQHSLYVVVSSDSRKPVDLLWMAAKREGKSKESAYTVRAFRTSLNGEWVAGVDAKGPVTNVSYSKLSAGTEELKRLKHDIDYFLITAVRYEHAK